MELEVRNKKFIFKTSEKQNIFFTSDTHFYHKNIINFCKRPFNDLQEMHKEIIRMWNETVRPNDIVFILGDIIFGGANAYEEILPQLNGKKYLILGNHDYKNFTTNKCKYFEAVYDKMFIAVNDQEIILNHEPLLCFGGQLNNHIWHLFGHVHTTKDLNLKGNCDAQRMFLMATPTMYDVGMDFNDYKPISFAKVKEIIQGQVAADLNFYKYKRQIQGK
jgi:calcineurin-like phosphoesterase family protein